jgi:hypothetical protein
MVETRAALFRKRALEAESKAFNARTEEVKRAWLIVARDWTKMAEREEVRTGAEALIRQLSKKSVPPST